MVAGFNDGGNLLAAASASRVVSPATAFWIITLGALAGPLVAGTGVAHTIGHGIVDYRVVGSVPLVGGIAGGVLALLLAYAARVPVSASVALVSATIGSLVITHQVSFVMWSGVAKVGLSLLGSVVVGFAAGAVIFSLAFFGLLRATYRSGRRIMRLQYLTISLQALGYGANDAEKMMGLMVAATLIGSPAAPFVVPLWVIAVSVAAFAAGMALGGTRVAKTVGRRIFRIRPLHALSFQAAAAATVLSAAALGGPLSTTATTASAIMGVGFASNARRVRWRVAREVLVVWLLTIPAGLAAGMAATTLYRLILHGAR